VFRKYYAVDEFIRVCINHCYINIHRIKTNAESLFNAVELQPIEARVQLSHDGDCEISEVYAYPKVIE
jgi:hypothetical protein